VFDLPVSKEYIRKLDRENLGVLGVYDFPARTRIFTAQNGAELVRRSEGCDLGRVLVVTAGTGKNLLNPEWERAKQDALFVIDAAMRREDKPFLREVGNRLRRRGVRRGRPPDLRARRKAVEAFKMWRSGKGLKSLSVGSQIESAVRSYSARVSELCWGAFQTWVLWGSPVLNESLSRIETSQFEELGFQLPAELDLLRQAIEQGKKRLPS